MLAIHISLSWPMQWKTTKRRKMLNFIFDEMKNHVSVEPRYMKKAYQCKENLDSVKGRCQRRENISNIFFRVVAKPQRQNFLEKKEIRDARGGCREAGKAGWVKETFSHSTFCKVWSKHCMTEQNLKMVATLLCWYCWGKWVRVFTPTPKLWILRWRGPLITVSEGILYCKLLVSKHAGTQQKQA